MSAKPHKRLGELLIEAKAITEQDLADAIAEQRKSGELLGATLIRMGVLAETTLMKILQNQLSMPLVDLSQETADEQALGMIKEQIARKYLALPLRLENRTLVVAMADPLNVAAIEDLRFHSGVFIQPLLALPSEITEAIDRYYHIDQSMTEVISNIVGDEVEVSAVREEDQHEAIDELMREAEGRPIVRLTNWLLHRAVEERASDIHIEPQDKFVILRFRIDGLLHEIQRLPKWTQGAIVSRIKVLSNLDIAEKRLPQDGRLMVEVRGRRVDMRVSTLPTSHGEKVVIRVVDQARTAVALDDLGLVQNDLEDIKGFLDRPQGIILVTGPTGSGKTTLLYSCLRQIQDETMNIVTVEDPVEFQIAGINQVQVDEKAKKTFPAALRAILRQDPDVIMVGEIRDKETAQIAFRASVTGHLVLSTVHTNDAAGAVTRLVDLGLEPFMVSTSLEAVISMRLVRTICPKCKESYEVTAASLNKLGARDVGDGTITLYRGHGCSNCRETGYVGRTGIFELLQVNDAMRILINQGATDASIRHAAVEAGMVSIAQDGIRKVMDGVTTLDEVSRVVYLAEAGVRICPTCKQVLASEHDYCTACGDFVAEHCEHCKRRVSPEWVFCPHCGEPGTRFEDLVTGSSGGSATRISSSAQRRIAAHGEVHKPKARARKES